MKNLLDILPSFLFDNALPLTGSDILSINTEDNLAPFAKSIAKEAKERTNNGSYIQEIRDGRIVDSYDVYSSFPLEKAPTIFIYVTTFSLSPSLLDNPPHSAKELQKFKLLSEPFNEAPSIPYITLYVPSEEWDNYLESSSEELISSLLHIDDDRYQIRRDNLLFQKDTLNSLGLIRGTIEDENGTYLSFDFVPSLFNTSIEKTLDNRIFSPLLISYDIFSLIKNLNGWFNSGREFMLYGEKVSNLSLHFENGRVIEFSSSSRNEYLFSAFINEDENATKATELTLCEESSESYIEESTGIRDYDKMISPSITLGGPRSQSVIKIENKENYSSLVSLNIPFSNKITIRAYDKDDNEYIIFEDNTILPN